MIALRNAAQTIVMLAALAPGCGPSASRIGSEPEVDTRRASFRDASPEQYLAAIFARYRNAASYHDRGVVRLTYQLGDRQESKIAPMQVWLDHNQLYVEAYDVRLWSDEDAMTAWISDEESDDFDSQVLRLPAIRGRPTVETMISDPILAQRIAAGLAGPPAQLEWLFAQHPMKQLFHGEHPFEYGQSRALDGRLCRSVRVHAGTDLFQFWIDQRAGIVRRVDLPPIVASPTEGQPPQTMSLSLELTDASFDVPRREPDIQPLPKSPKYVGRFVALPPAEPSKILGSRPPGFRLSAVNQPFVLTDGTTDRELTVLVRFSGDPQSIASVATMERWNASMPDSLRRRIGIAVLVDPQASDLALRQRTLPILLDHGNSVAQSLELGPGCLVILDRYGSVAWTQSGVSPAQASQGLASQGLVTLGAIVADVLDGVDVPGRIRDQWKEQVAAYRRVLSEESVRRK